MYTRHIYLISFLSLAACFRVTTSPVCIEEVHEVSDDEATPVGTADELVALTQHTGNIDATLFDGTSIDLDLEIQRGSGSAEWVEATLGEERTRRLGIGSSTPLIMVICNDHLRVPMDVDVVATDTTGLDLTTSGWASVDSEGMLSGLYTDGDFQASTFPDNPDDDPREWDDKTSFAMVHYLEDGLEGSAGWEGQRETDEAVSAHASYVVDFSNREPTSTGN